MLKKLYPISMAPKLYKIQKVRGQKKKKVEFNGFLVSKKLLNRDSNRTCDTCNTYSFDSKDDVYVNKYGCCFKCYIQYVEDREERWNAGWRPGDHK